MSNYWDLECRTCGDTCELNWNRGGDYIQQLIQYIPDIAKMGPVEDILSMRMDFQFPSGLLWFAKAHEGHDLIAVDEHGAYHGDCSKRYECVCCETRLHCRKPRGHEGECGKAEAVAGG